MSGAIFYKNQLPPNNNADDADVNGIYIIDHQTNMGTAGIESGYGILFCFGQGMGPGDNSSWRWQRVFRSGSFSGGIRTKVNESPWTDWTEKS